jgi:3-mercaptopyruvate sulfurtransferase SseA
VDVYVGQWVPTGAKPAIFFEEMPEYRELLNQVKAEIEEIDPPAAAALLEDGDEAIFVDVRERDEWDEGHIPGAIHVPRGLLE